MNMILPRMGTKNLQRKLYLKAKQDNRFRFYALYDKIYRYDILQRAYDLVRDNSGSPGVDGRTFEHIESEEGRQGFIEQLREELQQKRYRAEAVKRVYIPKGKTAKRPLGIPTIKDRVVQMAAKLILEPIFEADFSDFSFGYRPKRHAHQAMDAIAEAMRFGYTQVLDADLSKYFDTIPHDQLLHTVAERISDHAILALLKQWLKAPVLEEHQGRLRVIGGGKSDCLGTPQGGVISPLLANIYLNILDRIWQRHDVEGRYGARLIRYADDMVILCCGDTSKAMQVLQYVLNRLNLNLNEEKTKQVNAYQEAFHFLGFVVKMQRNENTGKWFPYIVPSKKAESRLKEQMKWITRRHMTLVPITDIVKMMNAILRGWGSYFRYGNCFRSLRKMRMFCENRLRFHLCYRHKIRQKIMGFVKFPRRSLYEKFGLYKLDIKPKWKAAQALG